MAFDPDRYRWETDPLRHLGRPCAACRCECSGRKRHDRAVCLNCAVYREHRRQHKVAKRRLRVVCLLCGRSDRDVVVPRGRATGDIVASLRLGQPRCLSCGGSLIIEPD